MYIETGTMPDGTPVGSTEPDADPESNRAALETLEGAGMTVSNQIKDAL